jgi:predicted nucleic acid-binding Zn ribbon protein
MRVAACWEEAVGSEIADHCQPSALRGTVLEVTADSSVWSQHLQMRRGEILEGLRRAMGTDAPADLRFRVG